MLRSTCQVEKLVVWGLALFYRLAIAKPPSQVRVSENISFFEDEELSNQERGRLRENQHVSVRLGGVSQGKRGGGPSPIDLLNSVRIHSWVTDGNDCSDYPVAACRQQTANFIARRRLYKPEQRRVSIRLAFEDVRFVRE